MGQAYRQDLPSIPTVPLTPVTWRNRFWNTTMTYTKKSPALGVRGPVTRNVPKVFLEPSRDRLATSPDHPPSSVEA